MSHHSFPGCLSYTERCVRCCGNCKGKPRKPVGGFTIPLVPAKEESVERDLVLAKSA